MPDTGDCIDEGDSSWLLISTVLVLGMMPALSFFEAGMLRAKNTLSIITQVFSGVATLSVMWFFFGFTLTFGRTSNGVIGDFSYFLLRNVHFTSCLDQAPTVPGPLYVIFQMMFATITPLLCTGAYAERLRFRAHLAFIVIWEILVYYPVAHWIWGDGFMSKWPVLDFAGGIVIHTTAGTASLVTALYLGQRKNFDQFSGEFPPSNLPLAALGTALLWMGWFGFNGGSAFSAGGVAVSAVVATQVACAVSAFTWMVLSWIGHKPTSVAMMNGALAGMAGVTPASGYITLQSTMVLGVLFGLSSWAGVHLLKHRWHIDDALDVSSVHGITGLLGALAAGICATKSINPQAEDGWLYGNAQQFGYQCAAVGIVMVYTAIITYAILIALDRVMGPIRLTEEQEDKGCDLVDHHEAAYHDIHLLVQPAPLTSSVRRRSIFTPLLSPSADRPPAPSSPAIYEESSGGYAEAPVNS